MKTLGGTGVSGADLDSSHEVQLETVDGRGDGLTAFGAQLLEL